MSISDNDAVSDTNKDTMSPDDNSVDDKDPKKRLREDEEGPPEGERKEERKAANRRSAFQSRLRKKLLIDELQQKVTKLSEELSVLKDNNRTLTQGLEASLAENRKLRFLHQQGGSRATPAGQLGTQNNFLSGLQGGGLGGLMGFRGF